MKARQDKPTANLPSRAGAADNESKDWLAQLAQDFHPLAQRTPCGVSITAGQIDRQRNYAIVIRIGDPHLSSEPERTRGYITQQLEAVVNESDAATYLAGACDKHPNLSLGAGIGLASGVSVYLTSGQDLMASALAVLVGGGALMMYETLARNRQLNRLTRTAGEILRPFRPHGPQPGEPERYLADPDSGTAIIYRKL